MNKKIRKNIIAVVIVSILITTYFISIIFYNNNVSREKDFIKSYGISLSDLINNENLDYKSLKNENIRITILDNNNRLLYDSINIESNENYKNNSEIIEAREQGKGESTRDSYINNKSSFYFALLLDNKDILRVSSNISSPFLVLNNIFSSILIVIFFMIFFSILISDFLSKEILKPINKITDNLESILSDKSIQTIDIYDELFPLVLKTFEQSDKINYQINEITNQKKLLNTIISNVNEGIIFLNSQKNIVTYNKSSLYLVDANPKTDFHGKPFNHISRNNDLSKKINFSFENKIQQQFNTHINEKNILFSLTPVLSNNKITGLIIFLFDYTDKYKLEKSRQEFAANVSHELKTPLTSINGYAEMLANNMVSGEDITIFGKIIKEEGDRLLNIIDSIIRLSKIESKDTHENFENVNLLKIAENVILKLNFLAKEKNIDIKLFAEDSFVFSDFYMMEELIYNLIENSIKYTNYGGFVHIYILNVSNYSKIIIKDNGIGISQSDQSKIFERFYIVDKSRTKKTQSTGLGLSIVKHIVKLHNGSLNLESELNEGTTINISLPKNLN